MINPLNLSSQAGLRGFICVRFIGHDLFYNKIIKIMKKEMIL